MKKIFVCLAVFGLLSCNGNSQTSPVFVNDGYAINGYDAVAYFAASKPVKGTKEYTYEWKGATWLFSSEANLESFKDDPEKFAPKYGGYCAYGCSNGYKAPTQPDAWTIVDEKLYFNYDTEVKALWQKDQAELISKADENWPDIMNK